MPEAHARLTTTQLAVLREVCAQKNLAEIATAVGLQKITVRAIIATLRFRFEADSMAELAKKGATEVQTPDAQTNI